MIDTPTCLILGAGASVDYGMPTGPQLHESIQVNLTESAKRHALFEGNTAPLNGPDLSLLYLFLLELGHKREDIATFAEHLRRANCPSIDFFLEARQEFMALGKAAIALIIGQSEAGTTNPVNGWMEELWHKMLTRAPTTESFMQGNKLRIITFNYDRSFEWFLADRFVHRYNVPHLWQSVVSTFAPLHANGSLGQFCPPDVSEPSEDALAYGALGNSTRLRHAMRRIFIHTDQPQGITPGVMSARMQNAKAILCIGFGYHATNLERIPWNDVPNTVKIRGTAYKMPRAERERVETFFADMGRKIELAPPEMDASDFLKMYGL